MRRTILAIACVLAMALASYARSEVVQHGHFRVAVNARLTPKRLPRSGSAPVRFALAARFIAVHGGLPPQLRAIRVEINRHGVIEPHGLSVCRLQEVQPSTTTEALNACGSALVGEGHLSAQVSFASEAPFPSSGKLLAFNGVWHGRPAILAHIYGPEPIPTSYTIPFTISAEARGTYRTVLSASLPRFSSKWGYVTSISLTLGRSFSLNGRRRSYLSAGCPAPSGFNLVSFPLSRARFTFAGHQNIHQTLTRSCRAGV
jgi:hypothetical protein